MPLNVHNLFAAKQFMTLTGDGRGELTARRGGNLVEKIF